MTATSKQTADREPTELEALLPFHAAARSTCVMPAASMRRSPAIPIWRASMRRSQDEYAETILLNESLGAPSSRAMQKLFAAIDAEPARKSASFNPLMRIVGFFSSLSPRTLAYAGVAGAVLVLLQAGVIGTVLVKDRAGGNFQTAAFPAQSTGARSACFGLRRTQRRRDHAVAKHLQRVHRFGSEGRYVPRPVRRQSLVEAGRRRSL